VAVAVAAAMPVAECLCPNACGRMPVAVAVAMVVAMAVAQQPLP